MEILTVSDAIRVHLGRVAYGAYKQNSGGKSLGSGAELPMFDDLPGDIREAWVAVGSTVYTLVKELLEARWAEAEARRMYEGEG